MSATGTPRKANFKWNDKRIQELKDLWNTGISAELISGHFPGLTRNAIIGKAHRLNLETRKPPGRPKSERTEQEPKPKRCRMRLPPKPPKPKPAAPIGELVSFMDSGVRTCRSIEAYDENNLALFCSNPKDREDSFCPYHLRRYYNYRA